MATINWPETLPVCFLVDSYAEGLPDNTIRDQFDVGPVTVRRRATSAPYPVSGSMHMTAEEWETLSAFYADVLFYGALSFGIQEQGLDVQDSPAEEWLVRFTEPPTRQRLGQDWNVGLKLEVLP